MIFIVSLKRASFSCTRSCRHIKISVCEVENIIVAMILFGKHALLMDSLQHNNVLCYCVQLQTLQKLEKE